MKHIHFIALFMLLFTVKAHAQNEAVHRRRSHVDTTYVSPPNLGDGSHIYIYVDQIPYPAYRIDTYMARHLIYPDTAIADDIKVLVTFTVTKTGAITDVYVPYPGSAVHDAAATHAISSMPDWLPGKMHGSYANIPFSLKVVFKKSHSELQGMRPK